MRMYDKLNFCALERQTVWVLTKNLNQSNKTKTRKIDNSIIARITYIVELHKNYITKDSVL